MSGIEFVRGEFQKFRAVTKIHLGAIERDIFEDDNFEFDGQVLILAGEQFPLPSLRGGIKVGWFVPIEDQTSTYTPQPADLKVHAATAEGREREQIVLEAASEEEQVVNTLERHHDRHEQAGREPERRPRGVQADAATKKPPLRAVQADAQERQTRIPAVQADAPANRRVHSPEEADEINRRAVQDALDRETPDRPSMVRIKEADVGSFQTVSAEDMDGQPVGKYTFGGAKAGQTGDPALRETVDVTKVRASSIDNSRKSIGTPRRSTQIPAEGNVDIREVMPSGATGDVSEARAGDTLPDLLGGAAQAGADPSNPLGWDTSGQWRVRVNTAVEQYGDNPAALMQILAVETDAVRKHIHIALAKRAR